MAASQKSDYYLKTDMKRTEKLRELQKQLPAVCKDYFLSVAMTTSTLTRLAYAYDFRLFFDYLCKENPLFGDTVPFLIEDKMLNSITARDISGFQEYLMQYYSSDAQDDSDRIIHNGETGIMRKLSSIRSLFEYLYKNKIVEANVTTLIELPKLHEKPILRLDKDEMEKLIHAVLTGDGLTKREQAFAKKTQVRDYAIIMLFLGTGIRVSECVGLDISDIDLNSNALIVTRKGGNQSILYFPEAVHEALSAYMDERIRIETGKEDEDALFLSLQKKRITQRAVENLVKKYALIAAPLKKRISPHKLRSTFGTNLYQETGDIYLVADVLGHADINTTRKHYAAMTESRRKMAAKHVVLPDNENQQKDPS